MEHVIEFFLRPTFLLAIVLTLAVANLWRQRRESRRRLLAVTIPLLLLWPLTSMAVAYVLVGTLERPYPPLAPMPERPEALVVLSGYVYGPTEQTPAELGSDTLYRCLYALELYRGWNSCQVLLSGGPSEGAPEGPLLADAMRDFMQARGVRPADLIVENRSRTTHENAVKCAAILRSRGIRRVVLVTDAKHMMRAALCFRHEGIEVVPAPCNYLTSKFQNRWDDYLPSPIGAGRIQEAFHEWLGIAYYRLRGWD
jgi:uncharacterized SAM-binding protein YcdF (DUF218 family)